LDYHLNDHTLIYARSSRGYKTGGFNPAVSSTNPFFAYRPEFARDVEVGIKSDFELGGMRVRPEFDLFQTEYTNVQRNVYTTVNGLPLQVTSNAASATIRGVELALNIVPAQAVVIQATYSYNDAHYDRYVTPVGQDFTGHPFEYTPRNKFSVDGRIALPIPPRLGNLSVGGTVSYQSSVSVADDPQPFDTIGAYALVWLHADWTKGNWDLSLFATNLANVDYRITSNATYKSSGLVATVYGEPRMFGGSARWRF